MASRSESCAESVGSAAAPRPQRPPPPPPPRRTHSAAGFGEPHRPEAAPPRRPRSGSGSSGSAPRRPRSDSLNSNASGSAGGSPGKQSARAADRPGGDGHGHPPRAAGERLPPPDPRRSPRPSARSEHSIATARIRNNHPHRARGGGPELGGERSHASGTTPPGDVQRRRSRSPGGGVSRAGGFAPPPDRHDACSNLSESFSQWSSDGGGSDAPRDFAADSNDGGATVLLPRTAFARVLGPLLCIFPKVEPLPWGTFALLTAWCAIPPVCFILFFTQMGFGEQIYHTIATELGHLSSGLALALFALAFALYMLDANEWTSRCGSVFLDICILAIVCGVVLLVLLITEDYPYGMVCLFAVFHPLWLLALKLSCYGSKETRTFVSWLSGPLLLVSVLIGIAWMAWVFVDPDNEWNILARVAAAERTDCPPDFTALPDCRREGSPEEACVSVDKSGGQEVFVFPEGCDQTCTGVYSDCLNGFILWLGPVLIGLTSFFLSFFCTFLRTEGAQEKDILNFGGVWMFLLFAMWVTTSLAGTSAGVTAALAALTLASFVASSMFVAVIFSKEERSQQLQVVLERLDEKYGKRLDYARGLFVVTCAPFIICYLILSMTNQLIRRAGIFPCSSPPGEERGILTTRTRKHVDVMKSWDRANVFTIATYWGIAFMVLNVLVATMTTVLLSWIIEKTAGYSLAVVTAIMAGVGVMMFLLPPVPGVPVYLALGIVLPAIGHVDLGWTGSVFYCTGVGLVLKLFSSMLQQKLIGENLSHYVKVRQFVGINSILMKAMRLVLNKDGLSVPKTAILVGGPDWPTSVLCGIMRLSLPQILLGTVPIVFLILPTCFTGALLYMSSLTIDDTGNPEFPWAGTVSTITASATAIVQFGSMVVAAYYLEQTASKRGLDIEAIPDDRAVKEADDKAAHLKKCYRDATQWNAVPVAAKLLLQISLGCIIASSYLVQIFSSRCFVPHTLTDSIEENLDGNVLNLLLPLGWVAVGLFCVSTIFIYLFQRWGQRKAHKLANGTVVSVSPEEMSTGVS